MFFGCDEEDEVKVGWFYSRRWILILIWIWCPKFGKKQRLWSVVFRSFKWAYLGIHLHGRSSVLSVGGVGYYASMVSFVNPLNAQRFGRVKLLFLRTE